MKKLLILASAIGLLGGVFTPVHAAKIKGTVRTPGVKTVTISLYTTPFTAIPSESRVDTLAADGAFEIDIPALERLSDGTLGSGSRSTQLFYDYVMIQYVRKGGAPGVRELPPIYREVLDPAHLFDDRYISAVTPRRYMGITNLFPSATERGSEIRQQTRRENPRVQSAARMAQAEIMPPRSRDYYLANEILLDFKNNLPNTALLAEFRGTTTESVALKAVDQAAAKYAQQRALIGQAPPVEMTRSTLRDTEGVALTFGEMLEKYRGESRVHRLLGVVVWPVYRRDALFKGAQGEVGRGADYGVTLRPLTAERKLRELL